ncbi:MAG TPA: hypothetical protein VGG03_27505 [Thermoanaerobaculia bacterium]|jgi:hypothetical protein
MRKLTLLTGALLVTMLALAGGLSTPRTAWALICSCLTNNDYTTTMNWGMGSDCTAAHNALVSHVNAEAFANCGSSTQTCLGELVITSNPQCWFNDAPTVMMYQEDGYRYYSCKECREREPYVY